MVARDEDPFRLSRRVVTAGLLASGLVWAAHPIPVRVDPPGSPGTDPFAGSISFATVPGWWGVGAGVLVLGWVGLALVLAMAPRTRGWVESVLRVVGVVLGAALAVSVVLRVATAVRVYLTGYGDLQLTSTLLVTWWAAASVAMALVAIIVLVATPDGVGRFAPAAAAGIGAVVGCVWPWAMLAMAVTGLSVPQLWSPTTSQLTVFGVGMAAVALVLVATAAAGWMLDRRGSGLIRTWLSRVTLLSGGAASGLCGMLLLMWSWAHHMAVPPVGEWLPVLAGSVTTALAAALPWTARRELDPSGIDPQARAGHAPGPVGDQARAAVLLPLAGLLPLLLLAGVLAGQSPTTTRSAATTPLGTSDSARTRSRRCVHSARSGESSRRRSTATMNS